MANLITITRIVLCIVLLFCRVFSIPFYLIYSMAGITDILDGIVARKTGTVSEFGSKLDTLADFVLVTVCIIKIIPVLDIETWMYVWTTIIVLFKVVNLVSGLVLKKEVVVVHSPLNKATGVLLFLLPFSINYLELHYSVAVVCLIATIAAIQEGYLIRTYAESR